MLPAIMPKSKRTTVYHLTNVPKKARAVREKLFQSIRADVPQYQYCYVFSVNYMRNQYIKGVRRELDDSRLILGKNKLMARALGATPAEAAIPGVDNLSKYLAGSVGLLLSNRPVDAILDYFTRLAKADFARAGGRASRRFAIPPGVLYATAGEVPPEHDVLLKQSIEPELRKLGLPTRMVDGKVVLGEENGGSEPYVVCNEGDILDSRQTRLLRLFGVCLSEFRIKVLAYWSSATGEVTEINMPPVDGSDKE